MKINKFYKRILILIGLSILYVAFGFYIPEYIHPNELNEVSCMYIKKYSTLHYCIIGFIGLAHLLFTIYYLKNPNSTKNYREFAIPCFFVFIGASIFCAVNSLNIINLYNIDYKGVSRVEVISKRSFRTTGKVKEMVYYFTVNYENYGKREIKLSKDKQGDFDLLVESSYISIYYYEGRLSDVEQVVFDEKK